MRLACGNRWLGGAAFFRLWMRLGLGLGLGLDPAGQIVAAGDEASAALVGEIRPRPLDHHNQAIAESDQKENVDEQPR